jgi:hypothetical protein
MLLKINEAPAALFLMMNRVIEIKVVQLSAGSEPANEVFRNGFIFVYRWTPSPFRSDIEKVAQTSYMEVTTLTFIELSELLIECLIS